MSDLVRARVEDHLVRLRLGSVATRLDAILSDAARKEPSYLAFLDSLLGEELEAKQKKRVAMGIQIAHFPVAKTLEDFDFSAMVGEATASFAARKRCAPISASRKEIAGDQPLPTAATRRREPTPEIPRSSHVAPIMAR